MSTDAPTDAQGDPLAPQTFAPGDADATLAPDSAEAAGTGAEGEPATAASTDDEASTSQAGTAAEAAPPEDPATHRFECRSCGYVYDPGEGVRKLGITPGTSFLELDPVGFRCPVCRSRVGAFRDIGPRSKPSGFEENLDFGLGVNRLTPGQKNVLIFGGFALAIAFFLSLYSLR
jgi:rubredoxin